MDTRKQGISVCAFLHENRKILIAKRSTTEDFLPGIWELVGGDVEFGESLEECLTREFQEELQLDIRIQNPFYAFTYLSDDNTTHMVEIDYFAQMKNTKQPITLLPENHSEYKWITKEEVDIYFSGNENQKNAANKGFMLLDIQS